jgi:hypothetical protein
LVLHWLYIGWWLMHHLWLVLHHLLLMLHHLRLLLHHLWLLIKPAAHQTCCLAHRLLLLELDEPGEVLAIEKLDAILRQWI